MESLTSAISVLVDTHDKEIANDILKRLGLNMSTFVNMAIKQLLYTNGLPFEVKNPIDKDYNQNNTVSLNQAKTINDYGTLPDLKEFLNKE